MARIYAGSDSKYKIARTEKWIGKYTFTTQFLDGATVSSATSTFGTSTNIASNTACTTQPTVSSPNVTVPVQPAEVAALAAGTETCYVGVTVTLSDGRIYPIRTDLQLAWG